MTRVYSSWPIKEVTIALHLSDVPDMGALSLDFRCYEPNRLQLTDATQGEIDTLEGDPLWVRL